MDLESIWTNILDKINNELNPLAFQTWFLDTKLYSMDKNTATIIVPLSVHKQHIMKNYKDIIDKAFNEVLGSTFNIDLVLEDEININTSDNYKQENVEIENNKNSRIESNLLPQYTFENFVEGDSNRFARVSALMVAQNLGKAYNPLFIYGNSGLGKTHLMHAIGNYVVSHTNKRVIYTTSEQFINDFVSMTRKSDDKNNFSYIDFFKQKYRNVDVLIIDDIQYLGGAPETQKEFFNTFNTLYDGNKQIIISSDNSPNDLKKLEDRLKTRFAWGLVVDILPPDFNLRIEIIRKKVSGENINVPEDVIKYIATNISGNVRNLEGSLRRVIAYATICCRNIDLDTAKEALKDFNTTGTVSDKKDIAKIQKVVADYFQISVDDLRSKRRSSNITFPRQIAIYLCRKLTDESFPKIGAEFGKDHATVMHSCDKIEKELEHNKELMKTIEKLEKEIR